MVDHKGKDLFDGVESPSEIISYTLNQEDSLTEREDSFEPKEFTWIIDDLFTQLINRSAGFFMGMVWVFLSYTFAILIWFGLAYLLTFTEFFSQGLNIALISITIGTFVLTAGANLVEYFKEENLNFQSYVHNAVTFIASGVAFLGSFILKTLLNNQSVPSLLNIIANITVLVINLIGGLLMILSLWVLLKLLWRLNQLAFWAREYENTLHPYSELIATIAGIKVGWEMGGEVVNDESKVGVIRTTISSTSLLVILAVPYLLTNELKWSVLALVVLSIISEVLVLLGHPIPKKTISAKVMSICFVILYSWIPYHISNDILLAIVVLLTLISMKFVRVIKRLF